MQLISKEQIASALAYPALIERLRSGFGNMICKTPQRSHIDFEGNKEAEASTLLLMPSWLPYQNLGVKIVTVSPGNAQLQLPSVQGVYVLFDAKTGACTHVMDASEITARRTAATSALASSYLSKKDSNVLLIMGTGTLAPELIAAHATVRPIKKVFVWGRRKEAAAAVCDRFQNATYEVSVVRNLTEACKQADIISCATLSKTPILTGEHVHAGQHIDLIGSYRPNMREADNGVITRASLFVDHYAGALHESGELKIPLDEKIIQRRDIRAELAELCSNTKNGREHKEEITLFKSVGHAMEDLIAAQLIADLCTPSSE